MLVSQLHEITNIDSEIVELHEKLETLYKMRADITSAKGSAASTLSNSMDDINLDDIDLSL